MSQQTVLVVEDDQALQEALAETLQLAGFRVAGCADGNAALTHLASYPTAMVVSDIQMAGMDGNELLSRMRAAYPRIPVLMMTAFGTVQSAVEAIHKGAVDYLVKPFDAHMLVEKVSRYVSNAETGDSEFIASDPSSRKLVALADKVAASDATVMITGESGSGKEVIARHIHRHSRRARKPFVAINCAAIPENMLEAILFGYEKGSFTGAIKSTAGKFEQAQGGTLLLDEISEMNIELQAKLLRVLQEREVERLGSTKVLALDVRVLATSNRIMREEVAAGRFREDLFYRLNVFPLHLPPLRDRPADILPIMNRLLALAAERAGRAIPRLSEPAKNALVNHSWPGNVRELDNIIQRALILQSGDTIEEQDLSFEPGPMLEVAAVSQGTVATDTLGSDLKSREQALILEALQADNGSRTKAAQRLGISQRTLRYKVARMREAGIEIPGGIATSAA